eukprot:TRINITY_DN10073_c0_g1_i1.p1 TRINITY_DN10073_c0_g1~~TRINITY_DN10073_c0_g1_i1.p1  ORF type:complete len:248 (+),score=20.39 TRINITY_DN10073_c0_g1_i1:256-999(+)
MCHSKYHHKNLACISDFSIAPRSSASPQSGEFSLIMAWHPQSLDQVIHGSKPIPRIDKRLLWMKQAATGTKFLHGKQIAHRDLKPGNMLISSKDILLISDFGASLERNGVSEWFQDPYIRTPVYTTMETIGRRQDHNWFADDIFAFGIVLREVIECKRPYPGWYREPLLLDAGYTHCPDMIPLIRNCCSERPEDRPTIRDVLKQLDSQVRALQQLAAAGKLPDTTTTLRNDAAAITTLQSNVDMSQL